jgi:hypothetical protein
MEIFSADYPGEMERRRKIAAARTMHGHRTMPKGSQEYRTFTTWTSMRQRCLMLLIGGQEKTLAEWAEVSGLNSSTIRMRLKYNGGVVDESILEPVNSKR